MWLNCVDMGVCSGWCCCLTFQVSTFCSFPLCLFSSSQSDLLDCLGSKLTILVIHPLYILWTLYCERKQPIYCAWSLSSSLAGESRRAEFHNRLLPFRQSPTSNYRVSLIIIILRRQVYNWFLITDEHIPTHLISVPPGSWRDTPTSRLFMPSSDTQIIYMKSTPSEAATFSVPCIKPTPTPHEATSTETWDPNRPKDVEM